MEFKKYQHIEKIGNLEVEGILDGTVYLFYKIDGTNSQVFLKNDGTLGFGSRNREVTPDADNAKFAATFMDEAHKVEYNHVLRLLRDYPNYIIYGEWLVPHTLKTYSVDSWKKFYVFDVLDAKTGIYLPYEGYAQLLKKYCPELNVIPLLAKLDHPSVDDIKSKLQETGKFLCTSGLGEGIVIKNYAFVNRFGEVKWAKMLTEDFVERKKDTHQLNKQIKAGESEHSTEKGIIAKYLTIEHISKEYHKLCEKYGEAVLNARHLYELLNVVFHEFWADNWEIILQQMHMPTIDFKALKQLADAKVKQSLGY